MRRGVACAMVLLLAGVIPTSASSDPGSPMQNAMDYLASHLADAPSLAYPIEAAAQNAIDPKAWPHPDAPVFAGLRASATGDAARDYKADLRIAHAVATAGYDPRDVNGVDFVALARAGYQNGQFGDPLLINDDIWAVLALRTAGVPATDAQIQAAALVIEAAQNADGGWSYTTRGAQSGVDMTGMALVSLQAAGAPVSGHARDAAISFIASVKDDATGGYTQLAAVPPNPPAPPSVQSTVWALHALRSVGAPVDPRTESWLRSRQLADGGFAGPTGKSDAMATAEAAIILADARYPLPSFTPAHALPAELHALTPTPLDVEGPFTRVEWTIPQATHSTTGWTFSAAGDHAFTLFAEGPHARFREHGTLHVRSARPIVVVPPDIDALRHVPIALDLGASYDPDGSVVAARIDWGDGNVSTDASPQHAFDLPGDRIARVRVQDDAGEWSDDAQVKLHVRDRAPIFDASTLPARIVADRVHDVAIAPRASDPDGDPVAIAWRGAGTEGAGDASLHFATLGEHLVNLTATDPYGGTTTATIPVDVLNLAPTLANVSVPVTAIANETTHLAAIGADADGPAPNLTWTVGNASLAGGDVNVTLAAGTYNVSVEARDGDGGIARATATLSVRERGAAATETIAPGEPAPGDIKTPPRAAASPPEPLPPLTFDSAPASARVGEPARFVLVPLADAASYRFDFGDGANSTAGNDTVAQHAWTRPGTFEVRATARATDGRESVATLVLHVRAAIAAGPAEGLARASLNATAPGSTQPLVPPTPTPDAPGLPAASARRESPALWALAPILLAALGARRGRGGAPARRSSR